MFNDTARLPIVQEMILAETQGERQAALDRLLPIQRADFIGIFNVMDGLPVTVRLLDPPIHEFLPTAAQLEFEIEHLRGLKRALRNMHELPETLKMLDPELHRQYVDSLDNLEANLAEYQNENRFDGLIDKREAMLQKVRALSEVNPMLGHRGVRLGLTHPEIYAMQLRAIVEAAAQCMLDRIDLHVEVMIPQVCTSQELIRVKAMLDTELDRIEKARGLRPQIAFGSMIEVVRACLRAASLAQTAEFFSFGTNDLTQAAFSFSREDAENKFLPFYQENRILRENPFEVLDLKGVGRLMEMAVRWGRETRPNLKVGICGEQGGQPDSVRFCHAIGLNYVSCSAPRVPIARLAAAQAKLREAEFDPKVLL